MRKGIALFAAVVLMLTGCGSSAASQNTSAAAEPAKEAAAETQAAETPAAETPAAETPAAETPAAETPAAETQTEETQAEAVSTETDSAAQGEAAANADKAETGSTSDTLVIYFSRTGEQYTVGVIEKGNTAIVAEMIAEQTGADLFEVLPADDHYPMTYDALTEVARAEQNDNARPAYSGELPDLSGYSTVFIGAPVWWGDWPMIMYTFFENNDFSGKKLIPFSTHEGSGLSGFDDKLKGACPDAEVLEGLAIRGNDAQNAQEEVKKSVSSWLTELGY